MPLHPKTDVYFQRLGDSLECTPRPPQGGSRDPQANNII